MFWGDLVVWFVSFDVGVGLVWVVIVDGDLGDFGWGIGVVGCGCYYL